MDQAELRQQVRRFIAEQLLFGDDSGLRDDTLLLEEGIVDSTGFLEIVGFLEKTYKIQIGHDELVPENLNSIANIVAFVTAKLSHTVPAQQADRPSSGG